MYLLAFATIFATLLLPAWLLLVFGYPVLRVLEGQVGIPPLLSLGEVDILIADLIIVTLTWKVLLRAPQEPRFLSRIRSALLPGLLAFILVMAASTGVSYVRSGGNIFLAQLVSFSRYVGVQIGGFLLLTVCLRTFNDVRKVKQAVCWLGYFAAASVYVSWLLNSVGVTFGEINPVEGGGSVMRYQGALGDSIKLFLLPFIFLEILSGRSVRTVFLLMALFAAGGRVGLIGLWVGLVAIAVLRGNKLLQTRQFLSLVALILAVTVGIGLDIGGIATRFTDPVVWGHGLGQRVATWSVGFRMAAENLATGLGFGGYGLFASSYVLADYAGAQPFLTEVYSQVLKATVDGGALGLASFLWMMSSFLAVMKRGMAVTEGELHFLMESGYVSLITLIILSPFVAWMLPASNVSYLLFIFVAVGVRVVGMGGRAVLQARLEKLPIRCAGAFAVTDSAPRR